MKYSKLLLILLTGFVVSLGASEAKKAMEKRIAPVGSVCVQGQDCGTAVAETVADSLALEMERLFIQMLVLPATILVWPVLLNLQMLLHGVRGQTKVWRPLPLLSKMVLMECLQWVCVWIVPMMNYLLLSSICLIVSSKLSLRLTQNLPIFQIQEFLYPRKAT